MQVVTPELLMAIFFEESGFRNIRQQAFNHDDWLKRWRMPAGPGTHNPNGNHAVGFGQVERESVALLRSLKRPMGDLDRIPLQELDLRILEDDNKSVQLAWRALHGLWQSGQFSTALGLMKAYGGPPNEHKVPGMIDCAALLSGLQRITPMQAGNDGLARAMKLLAGAFWNARHNGAFQAALGVSTQDASRIGRDLARLVARNHGQVRAGPRLVEALDAYVNG
jgi:hypothetical protein